MNPVPIAVVDPLSSGFHLAEAVTEAGHACVAVRSLHDARHPLPSGAEAVFDRLIVHTNIEETLAALREAGVAAVIAGCEPAVELADTLAAHLGLRGNSPQLSAARRNKYLMHQALRDAGVPALDQIRTADVDRALAWAARRGQWPVVVKPLESGGTDGVHICADLRSVAAAFRRVCGSRNIYGASNREVLVQEFVAGIEYVVDAVFRDGAMAVAAIWRYCKQRTEGGAPIYRFIEVVPFGGERQQALVDYAQSVAAALQIVNGPVHVEIMWDEARDAPVLIEIAARMHGGLGAVVPKLAGARSQVELTLDAYTGGLHFGEALVRGYVQDAHLAEVFLISSAEGTVSHYPIGEALPRLASYVTHKLWLRDDRMAVTRDLWTSPGVVILRHEDRAQLERDIAAIAALEASGALFVLREQGEAVAQ
jgi:biotin carboxylase